MNMHVVINGITIEWADNVRHLDNFVDVTHSVSLDCRYKCSMFIVYVNKLISKFGHLQPKVYLIYLIHFVVLFMDPLHGVAFEWFYFVGIVY